MLTFGGVLNLFLWDFKGGRVCKGGIKIPKIHIALVQRKYFLFICFSNTSIFLLQFSVLQLFAWCVFQC